MSISDILTSDILTRVTAVSLTDMLLTVLLSFCTGMFIFYIYQKTFRGVLYSLSFGLSLVALCMISAMLILAVSSNVVLSLGMVGALSIVRFRTAIKEPLDIVFLFWAISAGIILSAGLIPLAVFGSLAIGLMILRIAHGKTRSDPYLVIAHLAAADSEGSEHPSIRLTLKRSLNLSKPSAVRQKASRPGLNGRWTAYPSTMRTTSRRWRTFSAGMTISMTSCLRLRPSRTR